jgi:hypothetical protein
MWIYGIHVCSQIWQNFMKENCSYTVKEMLVNLMFYPSKQASTTSFTVAAQRQSWGFSPGASE